MKSTNVNEILLIKPTGEICLWACDL